MKTKGIETLETLNGLKATLSLSRTDKGCSKNKCKSWLLGFMKMRLFLPFLYQLGCFSIYHRQCWRPPMLKTVSQNCSRSPQKGALQDSIFPVCLCKVSRSRPIHPDSRKQALSLLPQLFTQAENKTVQLGEGWKELSQNKCTMPVIWRIKDPKPQILRQ